MALSNAAVPGQRVGYRAPTVAQIVGITYRQLDYWTRTDLVAPSLRGAAGSGVDRLYSFDDIVQLRVIKRLLDAGVSLQKVRLAIQELRRRELEVADTTLVSDGQSVYAVAESAALLDLLHSGVGVFAIALSPISAELTQELAVVPLRPGTEEPRPAAAETREFA